MLGGKISKTETKSAYCSPLHLHIVLPCIWICPQNLHVKKGCGFFSRQDPDDPDTEDYEECHRDKFPTRNISQELGMLYTVVYTDLMV